MKSFLQSFFTLKSQASSRWFEQPKKLLIVGLDAAGKTTFLYCIKDHEQQVVTTIPTIGFNVETVQAKNLNFTCWDVGGCDKIRPLWKHYFEGTAGIVFVVDSNDSERIQGAKDELQFFLDAVPSTVPLLVIANKMDLPAAKPVDWVLNSLGLNDVTNRHWEIMPCIAVSKEAAKPCLDCLQGMLCASPYPSQGSLTSNFASDHGGISSGVYFSNQLIAAPSISQYSNSSIQSSLNSTPKRQQEVAEDKEKQLLQLQLQQHEKQKLESIWKDWLSRAESIPLNEETRQNELFLQQLLRCNLPSWDHYQHIRLAYLLFKQYGVDEGFERIAESIRNYIANNSSQTNGKSFHATMTAFWSHFIAYWMLKYSNLELDEEDVSSERDKSAFYYFLLFVYQKKTVFTDIGQSGLFRQYYSNDVIFHGNAKESFQLPNLQPFPSLQYSPEFSFDGK